MHLSPPHFHVAFSHSDRQVSAFLACSKLYFYTQEAWTKCVEIITMVYYYFFFAWSQITSLPSLPLPRFLSESLRAQLVTSCPHYKQDSGENINQHSHFGGSSNSKPGSVLWSECFINYYISYTSLKMSPSSLVFWRMKLHRSNREWDQKSWRQNKFQFTPIFTQ